MTATITTELKANLKFYIDKAVNGDSVIITRPKKKNAVFFFSIFPFFHILPDKIVRL